MGFLDKLKNVFFEEVEDDNDSDLEKEEPVKLAKKIEFPKKKVKIVEENEVAKEPVKVFDNTPLEEVRPVVEEEEVKPLEVNNNKIPMMFEEEDFFDTDVKEEDIKPLSRENKYEKRELYQGKKETSYVESVVKTPNYTYTKSSYENKEVKGFKPSPIISPIYGILDKNYRKEEVVTKKEVKVVSNSYGKVDLDAVRNKAFGSQQEEKSRREEKVLPQKEEKSFYDVNNSKPSVDKVTLADADEYYNDLGLAYNVDYKDTSKDVPSRSKRYRDDSFDEKSKNDLSNNDDNLFDLIDSMYNKED